MIDNRTPQNETYDGYPSSQIRDATAWNMKMMFYVLILDIATMFAFVFWQMEVPVVCLSLLPLTLNAYLLIQGETSRKAVVCNRAVFISILVFISALFCLSAAYSIVFFVNLCSYDYIQAGYFPSLGEGIMTLFMLLLTFINTAYFFSAAWLLIKLNMHHNQ